MNRTSQTDPPDEGTAPERKLLYIIKAKEKGSTGFESYLKHRGWDVVSTSDLKLALAALFSGKIHCVLITVEHQNPRCLRLPSIIAQTSKTPVILFAEGLTQGGVNILRGSEHPYILVPPVSGPAVERMVLRIEKDLAAIDRAPSEILASSKLAGDDAKIIQQGLKLSENDFVHLFESDRSGANSTDVSNSRGNNAAYDPDSAYDPNSAYDPDSAYDPTKRSANLSQGQRGSEQAARLGTFAPSNGKVDTRTTAAAAPTIDNREGLHFDRLEHAPSGFGSIRPLGAQEFSHISQDGEAAVLVRATTKALKECAVHSVATDGTLKLLDRSSRVACLQIESSVFAGVLVLAFATDQDDGTEFMDNFRIMLMGYLNDEGVTTLMQDVPEFCLYKVSFEDWSVAEASFLKKSVHHNGEVGVSFFSHAVKSDPLKASAEVHMSKIGLQEIREDVPLAFDVYLYLPVNKKYIRYAARDRFLYDSQRNRLNAEGVTDVHINRESEKDVALYRLQIGLSDKVKAYNKKKGA